MVGAAAGMLLRLPHRTIAMTMSVGAGLLLAGASFKVAADAMRIAGAVAAAACLVLGAAMFSTIKAVLARFGAADRKRCGDCVAQPSESQRRGSGLAIALGHALAALTVLIAQVIPARGRFAIHQTMVSYRANTFVRCRHCRA